jgi:aminocarboxymuconate-semialdehyde decarboxylase
MIIDVHAHAFPPEYMAFLQTVGLGPIMAPRRETALFAPTLKPAPLVLAPEDLDRRFGAMQEAGVERQILSTTIAPYHADQASAVTGARMINDAFAALVAAHPQRLSFWASLPLPHVDASLQELDRAMDGLGGVGVVLQCFCQNETVVRDEFDPVFEALNRRSATIFFHPCQNGVCSHLINEWGLTVCAGASIEDSVVAMHLIAKQIPARFPDLKFIIPHFGGLMPMQLERLDGQMPWQGFTERPSVTARRFFYDTVGWGSAAALLAAHAAFGPSQLLPGSDWPVLLSWESYKQTFDHIRDSALPRDDVEAILHRNAQQLLSNRLR